MNKAFSIAAAVLGIIATAIPGNAAGDKEAHRSLEVTTLGSPIVKQTERVFFNSRRQALELEFEQSPNYQSLNGIWDFRYYSSYEEMLKNPGKAAIEISVPGNYERQGIGDAIYVNQPYDFEPVNPQPPTLPEDIPTAVYSRKFTPSFGKGEKCYLNIAGAKGGMYVYVNGKFLGYSEDAKNHVRYDLEGIAESGVENSVDIVLTRWSTGSYLECQDFWRLNGIERDVYITRESTKVPSDFDWNIVSTLDESLANGIFRLTFSSSSPVSVAWSLIDAQGHTVLGGGKAERISGKTEYSGTIPDVLKWSAEIPNLYKLLIAIDGRYMRFDVGFRRLEIVGNRFLVNGQSVKFKGVNLHEHNEITGHYVTREDLLKDLTLMRGANINAIRTCHYPQSRAFYELCDRLGFYVYDEANIESHGMGYEKGITLAGRPDWLQKHMDRAENMYYRTRNYPCVTILSLGNEAGNGSNFMRCYDLFKSLEKDGQNRPVVYERAWGFYNTDMHVPMYTKTPWFKEEGEKGSPKPDVPCEYSHAMGNSNGSLDMIWEQIYRFDNLQGGFIWDWVDQGLLEHDSEGRAYWTYGGDYGENQASDGNFCCNGVVAPDRTPHPAYAEVKHIYQDVKVSHKGGNSFEVLNRFYFRNLDNYRLEWTLSYDGIPVSSGSRRLGLEAQCTEAFDLDLPVLPEDKTSIIDFRVRAAKELPLVSRGSVIAYDQFTLKEAVRKAYTPEPGNILISEDESVLSLNDGKATIVWDKKQSILTSYIVDGKQMWDSGFGLRPLFWRGPTDNDYGNKWPIRTQAFKESSRSFKAVAKAEGNAITADYDLASGNGFTVRFALEGGLLRVDCSFKGVSSGERIEVPRIGLRMRLPQTADTFTYLGRGPQENYQDRFLGTAVGLYSSSASDEYVPYVRPQECGHHTGCNMLSIGGMTVRGKSFEFNALRQSVEDLDGEEATWRDYQWTVYQLEDRSDLSVWKNKLRRQTHINDVCDRPYVELCIDGAQTGVGGYDSWGARTDDCRTIWSDKDYKYSFTIVPASIMSADKSMEFNF